MSTNISCAPPLGTMHIQIRAYLNPLVHHSNTEPGDLRINLNCSHTESWSSRMQIFTSAVRGKVFEDLEEKNSEDFQEGSQPVPHDAERR